nr:MAG TPA: hypothetical protein [Herelleviridae sp.]
MDKKVSGIDIKTVRPVVKKERAGVKDPVRFPDVINGYENESKRIFNEELNLLFADVVKKMVGMIKNKDK